MSNHMDTKYAKIFATVSAATIMTLFYGTDAVAASSISASSLIKQSICDLEKQGIVGVYEPFDKDPATIEFAAIISGDKKVFTLVIMKKNQQNRCKWYVTAALDMGSGDIKDKEMAPYKVVYNCAALNHQFKKYVSYFGLIADSDLEYVKPKKAWSVDLNSMTFKEIKPVNIYCENFIVD